MPDIEQVINDLFPPRVDLRAVAADSLVISTDYRKILAFVNRLREEAIAWQEDLRLVERTERAFDFLAGHQLIPREEKSFRARVCINLFHSVIERKAGMLTDQIIEGQVISRSGYDKAARILSQVRSANWDERNGQDALMTMIIQGSLAGSAAVGVQWDPMLDYGMGDVSMEVYPPGSVLVDRRLRQASKLQDHAQYVIVEIPRPLAEFTELYETGFLVKPDVELSTYRNGRDKSGATQAPYGQYQRPGRREKPFMSSALPYAMEHRLYFRDHSLDPTKPRINGRFNYLFPRKRLIVWSGNVVLYDGDPKNWDGLYPLEIFDWGIETQHPYGESEVDNLASVQSAINVLFSGVVNNSILINDPPFVISGDAIDAEDEQELKKWGDRPGWVHHVNEGTKIERWVPGAMTPVVFQTLQMLMSGIEMVSGITPVTRGEAPGSDVNSGVAIESLMKSAQITIRRQSRAVRSLQQRIGQLQINRIIQHFPDTRILHLTNDPEAATQVIWDRKQFYQEIMRTPDEEKLDEMLANVFRDMRFRVQTEPLMTQDQERHAARIEHQVDRGHMPEIEELRANKIDDPEEQLAKAQQEQMMKGQMAVALQQQQTEHTAAVKQATTPPQEGG